jgi:hypothetical protein
LFHPVQALPADGPKLQKLVIGYAAPVASLAMIDVMKKSGLFKNTVSTSNSCLFREAECRQPPWYPGKFR